MSFLEVALDIRTVGTVTESIVDADSVDVFTKKANRTISKDELRSPGVKAPEAPVGPGIERGSKGVLIGYLINRNTPRRHPQMSSPHSPIRTGRDTRPNRT